MKLSPRFSLNFNFNFNFSPMTAGLLSALLYGFISISITFFNKAVLSSYTFHYPNIMTLFQMLCSLFFLELLSRVGAIQVSSINKRTFMAVLPLSIAFVGMVLTGLAALNYLNIPMFNALRRVTTLITMFGEKTSSTLAVKLSVYMMVVGAIVAGIYDFDYSGIGYFLVALNCVFTAAYLLYISHFTSASSPYGLNTWSCMYYNNVQSLPCVILICYLNNDLSAVQNYPYLYDMSFLCCFIFQSTLAFLLNYSIFLCTRLNSALATSVTGQIKNIATTAIGYVLFNDVTYSPLNIIGLVIGVLASAAYSWLKYIESEVKRNDSVLPLTSPTKKKDDEIDSGSSSNELTSLQQSYTNHATSPSQLPPSHSLVLPFPAQSPYASATGAYAPLSQPYAGAQQTQQYAYNTTQTAQAALGPAQFMASFNNYNAQDNALSKREN